ncbi:MAG: iron ABC transporter permease [Candidatus Omnitrophica bacterium]|nr:iron ABC transporter permease [Candidatus Omnitrophota bacterium]MBU4473299.1 iron ABC transporter permease [Candidatus Omnitrophota bacterium]MCG2706594.1 iron ABC transporter permease [Candidatus Omnitrophota bacterium]
MNKFNRKIILLLFLTLILAVFLGITHGPVHFSLSELMLTQNKYILYLRLSRILMAILAGMGLSVSGIALQAILKNPLAEPYLLGTSSGAGLGAVLAIIIGTYKIYLPFAAFLGAILAVILVYNLAKQGNKIPVQSLILSGVIVSIAFSGIIVFVISLSSNEALHGVIWWLWGSMQVYDLKLLLIVGFIVIPCVLVIYVLAQDLNAISIGEEDAIHLGINTETIKKILFFVTCLITASLVSICGIIGFVGLIIPHIMRFVVGPNHKILIPATCILAATFMIICDLFSRTLFSPLEIPIGVITAVVGAPIFIILLKSKQKVR